MPKYIKVFKDNSEYEAYTADTENFILPNVSYCISEDESHMSPYVEPIQETRVVAKYNVSSTISPTRIGYNQYTSGFSKIEIDGVEQPSVVSAYTFDTLGEHTVKYTLTDETSIGNSAFASCEKLTNIAIPNGVTSIGDYAFSSCNGLTNITIPSGVTSIGSSTFSNCTSLGSIDIPNNVTSIGQVAFAHCASLTSINIPSGVTSIGNSAFFGCNGITSCIIGSGVTSIGSSTFSNCTSLASVTCLPTTPPTLGFNAFNSNASGRKIYVPSASETAYKQASRWSSYAADIEPIPTP